MSFPPPTERQARLIWFALAALAVAALLGVGVGLVWAIGCVLSRLSHVLWPLAIAGVIACLLNPVVDFLERRTKSRQQSIIYVFGMAILLLVGIGGAVIPQLVSECEDLGARIPAYASRLEHEVSDWMRHPPPLVSRVRNLMTANRPPPPADAPHDTNGWTNPNGTNTPPLSVGPARPGPTPPSDGGFTADQYRAAAAWLAGALRDAGGWVVGQIQKAASWFGLLAGLGLIPVYTFYFLLEKEGISARWTDYLPVKDSAFKQELVFVLNAINNHLIAFFRGQVLVAMCDGALYGVGLLIIGVPYALLIGVVAMGAMIVPYLGSLLIASTALLIALVQYGDWLHPLLVLGLVGVVQVVESLFISPRIMGNRVGLHPLAIIVSLMIGTSLLGGVLGGLLAIPFAAALRVMMFRYVWQTPKAVAAAG